jgi:hypothetical protein
MKLQDLFSIIHGVEYIQLYNFRTYTILYNGILKDIPYKYYESHVYNITLNDNILVITIRA